MIKTSHFSYRYENPVWGREISHQRLGFLSVLVSPLGLARLEFCGLKQLRREIDFSTDKPCDTTGRLLEDICQQLQEYLAGSRKIFDLALDWTVMTPFMQSVLKIVQNIPYGEVMTYGEIAVMLGKPGASRAVGTANAHNPIPLIIPCHRVVGSEKKLHGFSAPGGLETKAWLLNLEGHHIVDQKLV